MTISLKNGTYLYHIQNITFGSEQGIGHYVMTEDNDYIPLSEIREITNDPWGD